MKLSRQRIDVGGQSCEVVENLGYQAGHYAKRVRKADGSEAVAVRPMLGGAWRFWGVEDRLRGPAGWPS